ncbi:trehalase family glycosidase [Paludibacter sp. 221]|uniref:MGH1-like glycoside hydrolase domain-containing protein n=1 Tax=Paludibacter sp. 221 TaxID=2302939 RepID=UPI0013CF41EB|nr:trehalase family glycosidase [Paludibacter sp. 221]
MEKKSLILSLLFCFTFFLQANGSFPASEGINHNSSNNNITQPEERGAYFYKKKYVPQPIPSYEDNKHLLPKPILDNNKGWVDMYDKCWQLLFNNIKAPVEGSPFVSNWYDEAFDNSIFQWDIIFMTMFGKYAHHIFPGIRSFDNFYCRQKLNGSICRRIDEITGKDWFDDNNSNLINPPLFSWAEVENYKVTGDKSRFQHILPVLEKYFEFVEKARIGEDTPHKLYWSNGQASGMDNTPRDNGRKRTHWASDHQGWVDMSSQMVIQCNNIAVICEELGYIEKAEKYKKKSAEIAARINYWMWNEEDGLYYDVDTAGVQTKWKTIACFWPMLAEITSAGQSEALINNLKNPALFWKDIPFPSLAASYPEYHANGGYWQGAVWAPTNYATIKGIEQVGDNAFAKEASERYIEGLYQVFLTTGTLWENYAPEKIDGKFVPGTHDYDSTKFCRTNFVGWTGVGPIALLIENVLGFRLNGADKILTYDLRRTDRHGVENLRMADITTSVICNERRNEKAKAFLTVQSDKPYKLTVLFHDKSSVFDVQPGTNNFIVK